MKSCKTKMSAILQNFCGQWLYDWLIEWMRKVEKKSLPGKIQIRANICFELYKPKNYVWEVRLNKLIPSILCFFMFMNIILKPLSLVPTNLNKLAKYEH